MFDAARTPLARDHRCREVLSRSRVGSGACGVSKKHLQGYLNEYAWRYNQRHDAEGRFRALLLRSTAL
jgi:hypothetical protein